MTTNRVSVRLSMRSPTTGARQQQDEDAETSASRPRPVPHASTQPRVSRESDGPKRAHTADGVMKGELRVTSRACRGTTGAGCARGADEDLRTEQYLKATHRRCLVSCPSEVVCPSRRRRNRSRPWAFCCRAQGEGKAQPRKRVCNRVLGSEQNAGLERILYQR